MFKIGDTVRITGGTYLAKHPYPLKIDMVDYTDDEQSYRLEGGFIWPMNQFLTLVDDKEERIKELEARVKELENKEEEIREGDVYYYVYSNYVLEVIEEKWDGEDYEIAMRDVGNFFLTKEAAEEALQRVKAVLKP